MKVLIAHLVAYYRAEPVRVNGWIASAAVAIAGYFHIIIDPSSVLQVIAVIAAIVGGAEATRTRTTSAYIADPPDEGNLEASRGAS